MLKREITYEDYNGEKVTEVFYFNLTQSELVELEVSYEGGLEASIKRIIEAKNVQALVQEFKKIILSAYGVRSEDGKRFIKNDQVREEFTQSAAYDALFMELATDDDAASKFITGILPASLVEAATAAQTQAPVENVELPEPKGPETS